MEGLRQDLRYAFRLLRRTPRNSSIAVTILALGIGANTAMFSAVNHVLLQPLPFPDADRLIRVRGAAASADGQVHPFNMTARDILAARENNDVFDGIVGFGGTNMTLVGSEAPERVSVVLQTAGNEQTLKTTTRAARSSTSTPTTCQRVGRIRFAGFCSTTRARRRRCSSSFRTRTRRKAPLPRRAPTCGSESGHRGRCSCSTNAMARFDCSFPDDTRAGSCCPQ
jgi:hypothetical protein